MNYITKFLTLLFLIVSNAYIFAEDPPVPPGGGGGTVGPGTVASPIDMYVYILIAVGIIMMAYYVKRLQKQNA